MTENQKIDAEAEKLSKMSNAELEQNEKQGEDRLCEFATCVVICIIVLLVIIAILISHD